MHECEHGDPHPMRCALCRRREDRRMHPERFRDVTEVPYLRDRPVPRPVNYDAMVDAARREWEASRDETPGMTLMRRGIEQSRG